MNRSIFISAYDQQDKHQQYFLTSSWFRGIVLRGSPAVFWGSFFIVLGVVNFVIAGFLIK